MSSRSSLALSVSHTSEPRPSVSPSCRDGTVTSDDLLSWLHPFCGDAALPVRPRIDVLQILESNFSLRDSDVRLLLLYRTQAVLKDREVSAGLIYRPWDSFDVWITWKTDKSQTLFKE